MRHTLKLVFASLLLGTSAYAQLLAEPETKPFHFSSRGSPFGLQAEFEGTYRIYDTSIQVYVSKATFYVSEHCPYQGRRRINYIKFALWNEGPPKKVENSAAPVYLSVIMSPREEYTVTDLYFSLPKERMLDLEKRWFVVVMQEDAIDLPLTDNEKIGYAYAHSCRDIFVSGVAAKAEQKTSCNHGQN